MSAPGRRRLQWLLPALLTLPFVVAVVVDIARKVVAEPPPDLDLLRTSELRFEPDDPVFDLRHRAAPAEAAWLEPEFELGPGWGGVRSAGAWIAGSNAELTLQIARAGQRELFVECRADQHRGGPVFVSAVFNGQDCGRATAPSRFDAIRFSLPEGAVRTGLNVVELGVTAPDREGTDEHRTVQVRRIVVSGAHGATFDELVEGRSLAISRERGTVLIQRAGRLVVPFTTTASGSVVGLRILFRDRRPNALCRITVARRFESPDVFDVINQRTIDGSRRRVARVRQDLRDRNESCAVLVEVDREAAAGGVLLRDLRVEAKPRAR